MTSVLIVDDEALARDRLKRMIGKLEGFHVVAEAVNGEMAVKYCQSHNVDVVLMDIRMPGMDGIAAARQLAALEQPPALIFCTAYGEYALEAFDVNAVGYLLKPVNQQKLAAALANARRISLAQLAAIDADTSADGALRAEKRRHLSTTTSRGGVRLIPLESIHVLYADQKYVTAYYLRDGQQEEALLDDSLKSLEDEFAGDFVRVHRNALVSPQYIEGLRREEDGSCYVSMKGCSFSPQVSRRHLAALRKLLQSL
jgi:two-component system response regulator AlgR